MRSYRLSSLGYSCPLVLAAHMRTRLASFLAAHLLASAVGSSSVARAQISVDFRVVPSLGLARGAGNTFADLAVAFGAARGHVELSARLGNLAFWGGCATVVPTKCGAGDGRYFDAGLGFRSGSQSHTGPQLFALMSVGKVVAGVRGYLGMAAGTDFPLGGQGLLRVEAYVRHLFDDHYRRDLGRAASAVRLEHAQLLLSVDRERAECRD